MRDPLTIPVSTHGPCSKMCREIEHSTSASLTGIDRQYRVGNRHTNWRAIAPAKLVGDRAPNDVTLRRCTQRDTTVPADAVAQREPYQALQRVQAKTSSRHGDSGGGQLACQAATIRTVSACCSLARKMRRASFAIASSFASGSLNCHRYESMRTPKCWIT
jgi:hypothetical protein